MQHRRCEGDRRDGVAVNQQGLPERRHAAAQPSRGHSAGHQAQQPEEDLEVDGERVPGCTKIASLCLGVCLNGSPHPPISVLVLSERLQGRQLFLPRLRAKHAALACGPHQ